MELHQLEAFVAVATELHFGHAAERLYIGQPTLSELVRRLERELGAPLLVRTTRRVGLTEAGAELLPRARTILEDVAAAANAVRRIAAGDGGTVRVGITPPVAPVLAPHLQQSFRENAPGVDVVLTQLWLPDLSQALIADDVDVAITCGYLPGHQELATEVFCSEPLLVGLRPEHRLAGQQTVTLGQLADEVLGTTSDTLFPAWAKVQQQALRRAGVLPRHRPLEATDLAAAGWAEQTELDWIMLIGSLARNHVDTVIREVEPACDVPFTLQWNPTRVQTPAVGRFVHHALTVEPPPGWTAGIDHSDRNRPEHRAIDRSAR